MTLNKITFVPTKTPAAAVPKKKRYNQTQQHISQNYDQINTFIMALSLSYPSGTIPVSLYSF